MSQPQSPRTPETRIAVLENEIKHLREMCAKRASAMDVELIDAKVTLHERIIFGLITVVLGAVAAAVLNIVIKGGIV